MSAGNTDGGLWHSFRDGAMGLNLLLAVLPNIAVTIIFLVISRAAEDRRSAQEHQLDVAARLLSAASEVILELYPPGGPPAAAGTRSSPALIAAEKKFESLYWGQLGLTSFGPVERCLTDLHQTLAFSVAGKPPSTDATFAFNQLELKLAAVAAGMRRELYGPQADLPASAGAGAATDGACGG